MYGCRLRPGYTMLHKILENIHNHCENMSFCVYLRLKIDVPAHHSGMCIADVPTYVHSRCSCSSICRYAHMYHCMNAKVTDSLILQSLEGKGGFGNCEYKDPNGFCYAYTEAQKFCSGTPPLPSFSVFVHGILRNFLEASGLLFLRLHPAILACRSCPNLYTPCFCVQTRLLV